jgi:hypothetical protein
MLPLQESNPNQAASIVRILPDIAEYLLSHTRGGSSRLYHILTNLLLLQDKLSSSTLIFSKAIFSVGDTSKLPVITHAEGSLDHAERYELDLSNPHFTGILFRLVRVLTTSPESWSWLEFGSQRFGTILDIYTLFLHNHMKILHGDRKAQFIVDHIKNLGSEHYPVYPHNQDPFVESNEREGKPQKESEEGDEEDAFKDILKCFLRLTIALSRRASVDPPSNVRLGRQENGDNEDDAKQCDILKNRFRGLFRFYASGLQSVQQPQLHLCWAVIASDRTSSLPQEFLSLLSEAAHDISRHISYHDETRHQLDKLFRYFFDLAADSQTAWYKNELLASSDDEEAENSLGLQLAGGLHPPSTERDFEHPNLQADKLKDEGKRTLIGLVEMIERLLDTQDPNKRISWLTLLTSWYRLAREKHLSSAVETVMHIPSPPATSSRRYMIADIYNSRPLHPSPTLGFKDVCKAIRKVIELSSPLMAGDLPSLVDQREIEIKQKPTRVDLISQWTSVPERYTFVSALPGPGYEPQATSIAGSRGVLPPRNTSEASLSETPSSEVWEGTPFIPYPPRSPSPSNAETTKPL